eukprot:9410754-Pyramimonas_sp.AAC.1
MGGRMGGERGAEEVRKGWEGGAEGGCARRVGWSERGGARRRRSRSPECVLGIGYAQGRC